MIILLSTLNRKKSWKIAAESKAQIIPFSTKRVLDSGAFVKAGWVIFNGEQIMKTEDIRLPGTHNLENILSAVAAAKLSGVHNEAIFQVLSTFTGVKHRLQFIDEVEGRKFYNDSKATNIFATKKPLQLLKHRLFFLLAVLIVAMDLMN